jgi:hypothetical protein
MLLTLIELRPVSGFGRARARHADVGLPLRASISARGEKPMLKRMILAGLLAVTAVPVLASDASYDNRTASLQSSTIVKADTPKHDCSCQKHHS